MSTDTRLLEIRSAFLQAIKETDTDTAVLHAMLQDLRSSTPVLLEPHVDEDEKLAIDEEPLHWNESYFSRRLWSATKNFSHERLAHLIQVRELFRQEGRKGFMPTPQDTNQDMPAETDTTYTPSTNLRKFVEEGDVATVQMALIVELENSRLDARALRSAMAWAKARVPGLFEPYTEKAFARGLDLDRAQWTQEYYGTQVVFLDTNFSEERFQHVIEVREYMRQRARHSAPPAKPAMAPAPSAAASPRQSAKSAGAQARAPQTSQRVATPTGQAGLSPAMRAALLVGGAVAVVVIVLLVMRK
jgi:hypothetical protein